MILTVHSKTKGGLGSLISHPQKYKQTAKLLCVIAKSITVRSVRSAFPFFHFITQPWRVRSIIDCY